MRQQFSSFTRVRRVPSGLKDHVSSDRVSQRVNHLCRLSCARIGMNSDAAKVMAEARLHYAPRTGIERLARRVENFFDNRRHAHRFDMVGAATLYDMSRVT